LTTDENCGECGEVCTGDTYCYGYGSNFYCQECYYGNCGDQEEQPSLAIPLPDEDAEAVPMEHAGAPGLPDTDEAPLAEQDASEWNLRTQQAPQ
jgi:hypothetical protein